MKAKQKRVVMVILIAAMPLLVFMLLPDYSRRALIYWYADTDDYKIFEYNRVPAGTPTDWPVHTGAYTRPDSVLLDSILQLDPLAFLVIHDDTMVYEGYYNGHTDTSISNIFSVTKTIVGLLTGIAIHEGLIQSVDDPIRTYLPEFAPGPTGEKITLKNLLQMASGLDYDEAYASPFSQTTRSYYGKDITRQMLSLGMKEPPGEHFDYVGASTQLLGMVLQKVTGMTVSEYASEKLWKPLGANQDALWSKDRKNGIEKMFCCFTPTAPDLARIGKLLCDSGVWQGKSIIPRPYFEQMTTPATHLTYQEKPVDFYGFQIWLTSFQGNRVIYARGIKGQYIIAVPAKKLVIVRVGNQRSDTYTGVHPDCVYLYLKAGFRMIENKKHH